MTLTPLRLLGSFYASSVGKKILVAFTALILLGFLPAHAIGNLLIFAGPDALNEYAHFLHTFGHGAGIWVFRAVMLAAIAIHIVATIQLKLENRAARAETYAVKTHQKSTLASRTMVISGLIILCFVIYHLLHFTVRTEGVAPTYSPATVPVDGKGFNNARAMVIAGFQYWPASFFYLVGLTLLCTHLTHGVASVFQTLGLRTRKTADLIWLLGTAYSFAVWVAFLATPVAVLTGLVK